MRRRSFLRASPSARMMGRLARCGAVLVLAGLSSPPSVDSRFHLGGCPACPPHFRVGEAPGCLCVPRRIIWRGTITNGNLIGLVTARTRYIAGRDIEPEYGGRFRCRGSGCPTHRGRIDFFENIAAERANEILFGAR